MPVPSRTKTLLVGLIVLFVVGLPALGFAQNEDEEDRFEQVIGDALRAYNEGDYDKALDLYFEAKVIKDLAEIDYSIARSYHNKSKCAAAEKFYKKAQSRISELPEAYEAKIEEHLASLDSCVEAEEPEEPEDPVVVQPQPIQPQPTPPPDEEKPIDWLSIGIMAGGGAVLLAGLGVDLGSAGLIDDHERYLTDPNSGTNAERRAKIDELESDIQTRQIVVYTLYGVGSAALITGTVLFLVRMDSGESDATAAEGEDATTWQLEPTFSDDSAGMLFRTNF